MDKNDNVKNINNNMEYGELIEFDDDMFFEHYGIELEKMHHNQLMHKRQPSIHTMFKTEYASMYADPMYIELGQSMAEDFLGDGDYIMYEEWLSDGKHKTRRNIFRRP